MRTRAPPPRRRPCRPSQCSPILARGACALRGACFAPCSSQWVASCSIFQTADDEYVPSDAPAEAIALPAPRRAPADSFGDMFAAGGGGGDGGGGGSEDALGPVAGPAPPPADGDVGHAYGFYDADVVSSIAAKPVAAAPHAPGRPASTTHGAASSSGASGVGAHVRSLSAQEARDRVRERRQARACVLFVADALGARACRA